MAGNKSFKSIKNNKRKLDFVEESSLPVKGGRVSIAEGETTTLSGLMSQLSIVNPDFYFEVLEGLDYLAMYHGEVSQAVDNIKQLGNTNYSIYFDDSVPETQAKEMQLRLKQKSKNWYAYSGGINSLITDLLGQVAISGALSAEAVPSKNLDGVSKAVLVSPKNIRFKYDSDKDHYTPHQLVNKLVGENLIDLNIITYKYIAMSRQGEKPYAVPPFLSALLNIDIGADMVKNLKYIVKKWGALGFLKVLVNAPSKLQGESEEAYYRRTEGYLDRVRPEIEQGMSRGFVVGYKGAHEMEVTPTTAGSQGAVELFDLNDKKMMSGLKQDPLMFGRNFSTTETLGRIILAKMTTQISSYQRIVGSFLETLFLMDLQLAGYNIKTLDVVFDAPLIGDKLRDEQVRTTQINNAQLLYNAGIISQQQFAIEVGYEKPDQEEPRSSQSIEPEEVEDNDEGTKKTDPTEEKGKDDKKDTSSNSRKALANLGAYLPEFPYEKSCSCSTHVESFAGIRDDGDKLSKFILKYYDKTKANYTKASKKVTQKIGNALAELGEGASVDTIYDKIMYTLATEWGADFSAPQKKVVNSMVNEVYEFFRKDKSILKGVKDIPVGTFNTTDLRALDYFKDSDNLYLGKFITDADVQNKVTKFLKDNYLTGELPIGNNRASINAFKAQFIEVLDLQDWKIVQIVSTSVSKMRNTASVSYMNQAGVMEYEILGISDRLQCDYCRSVQGKKFSVATAYDHVDNFTKSNPEYVGIDSPFINSVYKKPEEVKALTGEQLQRSGVHTPPFHPLCRDTIAVIL